ncbi:MAG: hypothetical protein A3F72_21530 [Bacteroidetes bacterium RIFCSPLOWO2_12_FULL_35_15]|nr:MAG: hypothetical protein A3F72_21530 [Bacteroidetes bacterium RIFCSPLOWO2_12_FULL_35_15]
MENKTIKATEFGPEIILETTGNITISGKSRMEDASLYYKEAHDWLLNYKKDFNNSLTVTLDLSYFNSSSAKQLLKLLLSINDAAGRGKVIWIYPENNDILLERGQELEIMLDLPFEYKSK